MKTLNQTPAHSNWMPYLIASVKCENRTGFIGRMIAMNVGGIECVLMAKTDADLSVLGRALFDAEYDPSLVYKTTMIQSVGIEVAQISVDEQRIPPVIPEKPAAPAKPGTVPVRGGDGVPVVQYENSTEEKPAVGEDGNAFKDLTLTGQAKTDAVVDDEL